MTVVWSSLKLLKLSLLRITVWLEFYQQKNVTLSGCEGSWLTSSSKMDCYWRCYESQNTTVSFQWRKGSINQNGVEKTGGRRRRRDEEAFRRTEPRLFAHKRQCHGNCSGSVQDISDVRRQSPEEVLWEACWLQQRPLYHPSYFVIEHLEAPFKKCFSFYHVH